MADLKHIFLGLHSRPQPGGPHPVPSGAVHPGMPPAVPVERQNVRPPHGRPGQPPPIRRSPGYGGKVFDTGSTNLMMEGGS